MNAFQRAKDFYYWLRAGYSIKSAWSLSGKTFYRKVR